MLKGGRELLLRYASQNLPPAPQAFFRFAPKILLRRSMSLFYATLRKVSFRVPGACSAVSLHSCASQFGAIRTNCLASLLFLSLNLSQHRIHARGVPLRSTPRGCELGLSFGITRLNLQQKPASRAFDGLSHLRERKLRRTAFSIIQNQSFAARRFCGTK